METCDSWVVYCRTQSRRNLHRFYGGAQKSWDQFDEFDSHSLRCLKQISGQSKDHCLVEYNSKFLISAVSTLQNLRIGPRRRLKDKSDAPADTRGDWPRMSMSSKKRTTLQWVEFAGPIHHKIGGKRICCRFRREHPHVEQDTKKVSKNPTTVVTANGEVQTREEATGNVRECDLFVTVMFLEDTPAVLSVEKLCEDHGYTYHWIAVRRIEWNTANYVPFVDPGPSTSSSSSSPRTSPTSSWQEAVIPTQHPASAGSEELRRDSSRGPAETEKPK